MIGNGGCLMFRKKPKSPSPQNSIDVENPLSNDSSKVLLKTAIRDLDGNVYVGHFIDTHYDVIDAHHLGIELEKGFVTPENIFLSRVEAYLWVKEKTPDIAATYDLLHKKASPNSILGRMASNELESMGYQTAAGLRT